MRKNIVILIITLFLVSITSIIIIVANDNACIKNLNYSKEYNMIYTTKVCDNRVSLINEKGEYLVKPIKGTISFVNGYYMLNEENEKNAKLYRVEDDSLILKADEMSIIYDTEYVMYTKDDENYIFDTSTEKSKQTNFTSFSMKNNDILGYQGNQYYLLNDELEKANQVGFDNMFYHYNDKFYFPNFDDSFQMTHIDVLDTKTRLEYELLTSYDIESFETKHGVFLVEQRNQSILIGQIESDDFILYPNYEVHYFFDNYFAVKVDGNFKFFDYDLNPMFIELNIVDVLSDITVIIDNDTYKLYNLTNGEECTINSNKVTKFSEGLIAVYKVNEIDFYKDFEKVFSIDKDNLPEFHMAFKVGNKIDVENDEYFVLFLDPSNFTKQQISVIGGYFNYNVFNEELVDEVVYFDGFSFIIFGLDGYVSLIYDLNGELIYKRDNIE